jgi:type II secretory pathway component PulC
MKKSRKSYTCKALFVGRLSLVLLLLFTAGKMLLFPAHLRVSLPPLSAVAQDKVRTPDGSNPKDFLFNDYSEILKRNPFGLSDVASKNNSSTVESPLSDDLGLMLLGTISGSPPVARAIIKNLKTGGLDLYRVGQTVENARIESIEPDTVILLHNGQKKALRLNLWLGNILHPAGDSFRRLCRCF